MSPTTDAVEILAATIPDTVDLDDDRAVAEYVCNVAGVAGYTLSTIAQHIDAITERAGELRRLRNENA